MIFLYVNFNIKIFFVICNFAIFYQFANFYICIEKSLFPIWFSSSNRFVWESLISYTYIKLDTVFFLSIWRLKIVKLFIFTNFYIKWNIPFVIVFIYLCLCWCLVFVVLGAKWTPLQYVNLLFQMQMKNVGRFLGYCESVKTVLTQGEVFLIFSQPLICEMLITSNY